MPWKLANPMCLKPNFMVIFVFVQPIKLAVNLIICYKSSNESKFNNESRKRTKLANFYHLTTSVGNARQIMVLNVQSTFEQRNSSSEGAHCNAVLNFDHWYYNY